MNVIKNLSLVFLSIFITLIFLEFFLRLVGHVPFEYRNTNSPHPSIYIQDDITGWSNKEGSFNVKIDEGNIVQYNILKDGSRYSGSNSDDEMQKDKIILIGGSFTLGQAINDNETFAFKIQTKLDNYEVKNYGSGGFGTVLDFKPNQAATGGVLLLTNVFGTIHGSNGFTIGEPIGMSAGSRLAKINTITQPQIYLKSGEILYSQSVPPIARGPEKMEEYQLLIGF